MVPFAIVFVVLFLPTLAYFVNSVNSKINNKVVSLQEKSKILDEEYKQIESLVKKYGVHKEFLRW